MAGHVFNTVYSHLVDAVYSDDIESQRYYLTVAEKFRNLPVDYMLERGCLFIPNNEYIRYYIGAEADSYGVDFYIGSTCLWTLFLMIPITNLASEVVGVVGWDIQNKFQELNVDEHGLPMYKVSSKNVFAREKYFLTDVSLLRQTFEKRVIFITDGVFDSVSLNYRGIPAIALLGSTFSKEILYFLRWYSKVYVCADNDVAGVNLYRKLKSSLPNVRRVIQNKTKDIDDLLRNDGINGPITCKIKNAMDFPYFDDIYL